MRTKILSLLPILIMGFTSLTVQSQAPAEPVKPALLVIDIQNAFLPMIPEADREAAMGHINYYIATFLVKDAIISHDSEYTNNIEIMFDAVSQEVVTLVLESAAR
ncbi:MAG: hypothetical protein P1P83_11870 [Bacteroidales bacterium]|nr:hypothetical protein [Bacteroidales bacterium]MDT8374604.1 hypothetical protein [Bacteroidales bacterium]